jgi:hypothetical protein
MQNNKQEPIEIQDETPTLEDLRRELSIYDDEPSDSDTGWDLGKEETL